jgi:hypothetical protein
VHQRHPVRVAARLPGVGRPTCAATSAAPRPRMLPHAPLDYRAPSLNCGGVHTSGVHFLRDGRAWRLREAADNLVTRHAERRRVDGRAAADADRSIRSGVGGSDGGWRHGRTDEPAQTFQVRAPHTPPICSWLTRSAGRASLHATGSACSHWPSPVFCVTTPWLAGWLAAATPKGAPSIARCWRRWRQGALQRRCCQRAKSPRSTPPPRTRTT